MKLLYLLYVDHLAGIDIASDKPVPALRFNFHVSQKRDFPYQLEAVFQFQGKTLAFKKYKI